MDPTLNPTVLDPHTENLIKQVVASFLKPVARGECRCHWIEAKKTPVLMWRSAKDPNLWVLKIAQQKFLGIRREDKNGGQYWKFYNAEEIEEKASAPTTPATPSSPSLEKEPPTKPEPPVDLPSPETEQVKKFTEKYGSWNSPSESKAQ